MIYALILLALAVYLPFGTWLFYLACMHLDRMRWELVEIKPGVWTWREKPLHPVAEFVGFKLLLPLGLLHNCLHNFLTMTLVFLDPPRELVTTGRMNRYRNGPDGWRKRWAQMICTVLLDTFDRRGTHT